MTETLPGRVAAGGAALTASMSPQPHLEFSGTRARNLSERLIGACLFLCGAISMLTTVGIVLVLLFKTIDFFQAVSPWDFYTGTTWTALFDRQFGVIPIVLGTLLITLISMVVGLPLGVMSAIYLSEYASGRTRAVLKPALELLAGIPTIVYGFFALTFITPQLIRPLFSDVGPFNALAAGIAIGIMVLPMVASLSEDAMNVVPNSLREGAYALGATRFETATRVVLPAALSGIFASFILAISRAIGETMIVVVAAGNRAQLTVNPLEQIQAMTSYIVAVISGDTSVGGRIYNSLFAVGATLFVMTLLLNILSQWLVSRYREVYQ